MTAERSAFQLAAGDALNELLRKRAGPAEIYEEVERLYRDARCGSLQPGKRADLIMLNVEDYREVAHQFGVNHVHMVVKNGAIVYQEGEVANCSGR